MTAIVKLKTVVDVKGLKKDYEMEHGLVKALRGIDLTIHEGEMLAIMGPSGSGKSTLMHVLGCLEKPSIGTYLLQGKNVSDLEDDELSLLRARQIGFVFQSFNLIPQLNVIENVRLSFFYGNHEEESESRILKAIEQVGLKNRMYHSPMQLSGGEVQRVAIARALAKNPSLILADEPTGNLDRKTSSSILSLFQDLNIQGVTIVVVTHDQFVGQHCTKVVSMKDGLIVETSDISHK